MYCYFFFNDTATTEIYTLSLHDALPISRGDPLDAQAPRRGGDLRGGLERRDREDRRAHCRGPRRGQRRLHRLRRRVEVPVERRSEEHTSELQSRQYLVCRLLLEKKKKTI